MNCARSPTLTCTSPRSRRTERRAGLRRIWSVAVDGALYVRGYNGQESKWYRAAARQKAARILTAGLTKEVTFDPVEGPVLDSIEDAYRAKYRRYAASIVNTTLTPQARAATLKLTPR